MIIHNLLVNMVDKKKAKKESQYKYQKNAHMMLVTKNIYIQIVYSNELYIVHMIFSPPSF